MSQEINNREYRSQVIRDLLEQLHAGKTVDEVKAQFEEAFEGVSASEISEAEQALIQGGMPVEEVQRLCDVHAAVFKGSIEEIHRPPASERPGHPAHTLRLENRAFEHLIRRVINPAREALKAGDDAALGNLRQALSALGSIDAHYSRKENLFFPHLEKHGITAPPQVMWGVDDEIRGLVKASIKAFASSPLPEDAHQKLDEALTKVEEMIFKEDNILLPMMLETLSDAEWASIAEESPELGYALIDPPPAWKPEGNASPSVDEAPLPAGDIRLPTGILSLKQLTWLLNTLPVDITFVDAQDTVKYFSEGAERVFPRTRAIIGRQVINCHPPASMHIVQNILDDFRAGRKDHEDFWIKMAGKYIYIRYFAVHDEAGNYAGTLEVTQNIAPIQALTGEKRLVEA